jgi:drug/metabolite transporter (DMT)-like permease
MSSPIDELAAAPAAVLAGLCFVALLGTAGHLLLIMGLGKAPASTLMPFQYTQLAAAALAGWVAFGVVPDGWGLVGMVVIGICGAAAAWLNVRDAAQRRRPVTPVTADTVGD